MQVRSTLLGGTKLIEVALCASMLNSNDVFLLKDDMKGYIWIGAGANDVEINAARFGASKYVVKPRLCRFLTWAVFACNSFCYQALNFVVESSTFKIVKTVSTGKKNKPQF